MSLRRAVALARPRAVAPTAAARRFVSDHAHDEHHHHDEHADSTVYPKEDFSGGSWAYGAVLALGGVAFYQFAPAPGEDAFLTRFLAHYATPSAVWARINGKHLALSGEQAETAHFTQNTEKSPVHRYRYPQSFEMASPHLVPVGMHVDVSDVVVKS